MTPPLEETGGLGVKPPQSNFDRVARIYRWCEYLALGPLLERTRMHHLPALSSSRHALVLGDGDGRFTAGLLAANPHINIHAVDSSASMLKLLRANARKASATGDQRLRCTKADALEIIPPRETDLVVTHFFLDCLAQQEVNTLCARLALEISPGALWLVSEFRIPAGLPRRPARAYIRLLYAAFRLLTGLRTAQLPDHGTALQSAGFIPVCSHRALFGVLTTELWQLGA